VFMIFLQVESNVARLRPRSYSAESIAAGALAERLFRTGRCPKRNGLTSNDRGRSRSALTCSPKGPMALARNLAVMMRLQG